MTGRTAKIEDDMLSPAIRKYFVNQTCLITGGSSGIGYSLARHLVLCGSSVVLLARNRDRLDAAVMQLEQHRISSAQRITALAVDIQDADSLQTALSDLGPIDILINSAGIVHPGYFEEQPIEQITDTININLLGAIRVTKAVLPTLCKRGSGHIVNVSSVAGFIGVFGYAAYSGSKFGLWGFSESLRAEMKRYHVAVSVVFPPDTETPMLIEERKAQPSETRAINQSAGMLHPDRVSLAILEGLRKKRFLIFPGYESRVSFWIRRFMPALLNAYLDYVARKNRPTV
jgi:3-dehydrosphinganine reductase